ncbi:hypothetical protein DFH06DRAFT_1121225 [Mycena polygramma]|nr:hypothetical protein DFH06DRAFT_1121225 [Mycena polygramma]
MHYGYPQTGPNSTAGKGMVNLPGGTPVPITNKVTDTTGNAARAVLRQSLEVALLLFPEYSGVDSAFRPDHKSSVSISKRSSNFYQMPDCTTNKPRAGRWFRVVLAHGRENQGSDKRRATPPNIVQTNGAKQSLASDFHHITRSAAFERHMYRFHLIGLDVGSLVYSSPSGERGQRHDSDFFFLPESKRESRARISRVWLGGSLSVQNDNVWLVGRRRVETVVRLGTYPLLASRHGKQYWIGRHQATTFIHIDLVHPPSAAEFRNAVAYVPPPDLESTFCLLSPRSSGWVTGSAAGYTDPIPSLSLQANAAITAAEVPPNSARRSHSFLGLARTTREW